MEYTRDTTAKKPKNNQNKSPKIPELVMEVLVDAVERGQIQVGEELSSERLLAETLGVCHGSLRECLAILEFLGAIESRGYRKVMVKDADYIRKAISFIRVINEMESQNELSEFRKINEIAIVEFACHRATQEDLDSILDSLNKMESNPDDLVADVAFHDAIAVASHNEMLGAMIRLIKSMLVPVQIPPFHCPNFTQVVLESHRAIYNAIRERNVDFARKEMKCHLELLEKFQPYELML
jgi:GntR family transcriptional repressor for pyruvate dehydrogenase complex